MATDDLIWAHLYPNSPMPGTAEPRPGKCGAKLVSKRVREAGITRYCGRAAGHGTGHLGEGRCKYHLGNTVQHVRSATVATLQKEVRTLAERLGEPEPLGHPEIEAWKLASKAKTFSLFLEEKMDELQGYLVTTDNAGIEHARAMIDIMGQAWDRLQGMLEFAMKHELQKRIVTLEEHQASRIGESVMRILLSPELNLDPMQIEAGRRMFSQMMTDFGSEMDPSWAVGVVIDAEVVED
jgi:hypothetical protein